MFFTSGVRKWRGSAAKLTTAGRYRASSAAPVEVADAAKKKVGVIVLQADLVAGISKGVEIDYRFTALR